VTAAAADEHAIERLITALVQHAPAIDDAIVRSLIARLHDVGSPLALSIARIVELVGEGLVDLGGTLPALAMGCRTLADGIHGKLGEREQEAARYEIDTLLPVPDAPSKIAGPDVPLSALRRR
jgi:hypothetical protein